MRRNKLTLGLLSIVMQLLLVFLLIAGVAAEVRAEEEATYTNPRTGYVVVIEDQEDLLTAEEEANLIEDMIPLTEYGNVAFVSCYSTDKTTASYANDWYYSRFGNDSGTAFVIDMYNRIIQITSAGDVYKVITKGYANTITDNVYTYAKRGDYYGCVSEAYSQAFTLLEGGRIARPMKHITNILVALSVALIGNYILARYQRYSEESPERHVFVSTTVSTLRSKVKDTRLVDSITYEEVEVSSDSGGGFFSGGGGGGFSGGGGGGFSGGGGGHSF